MMRKLFPMLAIAVLFSGLSFVLTAQAADEKTLEGDGLCAKCGLKEAKACQNTVTVDEGGTKVTYYIAKNKVSNDAHKGLGICTAQKDSPVKIKVTGAVSEKDGKKVITASKIEKAD